MMVRESLNIGSEEGCCQPQAEPLCIEGKHLPRARRHGETHGSDTRRCFAEVHPVKGVHARLATASKDCQPMFLLCKKARKRLDQRGNVKISHFERKYIRLLVKVVHHDIHHVFLNVPHQHVVAVLVQTFASLDIILLT